MSELLTRDVFWIKPRSRSGVAKDLRTPKYPDKKRKRSKRGCRRKGRA